MREDEVRGADGGIHVLDLAERPPGLRQGGDRQAVPRGQDLVVGRRVGSALADLEQLGPRRLELAGQLLGIELRSPSATASSGSGRHSTFVPSQLPSGVAPNAVATASPAIATSSSQGQTKNRPSTPSLSASWEEKNAPSACRSSRSRYSQVSVATRR